MSAPDARIEWRCTIEHRGGPTFHHEAANRADAEEWARLERLDYPHAVAIYVESREVTPWEKADA